MLKKIATISLMAEVAVGLPTLPGCATSKTGSVCTVFANTPFLANTGKATATPQINCTFSGARILR